jgi:hypothetical protein
MRQAGGFNTKVNQWLTRLLNPPIQPSRAGYEAIVDEEKTPPVEEGAEDDPRRHQESPRTPPGEDSGEERAEKVAGKGRDVSDEESYEGGLPA